MKTLLPIGSDAPLLFASSLSVRARQSDLSGVLDKSCWIALTAAPPGESPAGLRRGGARAGAAVAARDWHSGK